MHGIRFFYYRRYTAATRNYPKKANEYWPAKIDIRTDFTTAMAKWNHLHIPSAHQQHLSSALIAKRTSPVATEGSVGVEAKDWLEFFK